MNTTQAAIIQLLQSYIGNKDKRAIFPQQVDWKEVCDVAVKHNIAGMLYAVIKKNFGIQKPEESVLKKLQTHFYGAISHSTEQDREMLQVEERLRQNKIIHVLMKGYILKQCYPIPELRTMGDVDFLIREEDRYRTHQELLKLGFTCTCEKGFVWCYQKGNTNLEVHSRIIAQKVGRGVDTEKYYLDAISHTEAYQGEYTRCFKKEYHLVYLFVHAAKHFQYAGYGLRGMLDFVVFIEKYQNELDWSYIWSELEKMGLSVFAKAILMLCKEWFGLEINFEPIKIQGENYEKMKEIIFAGGVYGYCGRNMESSAVRNQLEGASESKLDTLKWKAMIKLFFPDKYYMRVYMKSVEKYSFLLPIAWVIRWYQVILKKGFKSIKRIKMLMSVDEEVRGEYDLLKELRLLR